MLEPIRSVAEPPVGAFPTMGVFPRCYLVPERPVVKAYDATIAGLDA
jgi:hypothetical protein